jgi:hypothetical protein
MRGQISITRVRFRPASRRDVNEGLLGWVKFEHGGLLVEGVTVRRTRDGKLALSFPRHLDREGRERYPVRPISDRARRAIERQIFAELNLEEAKS